MEAAEFKEILDEVVRTNGEAVLMDGKKRKYRVVAWPQKYCTIHIAEMIVFFDTIEDMKNGWVELRTGWHTAASIEIANLVKVKA